MNDGGKPRTARGIGTDPTVRIPSGRPSRPRSADSDDGARKITILFVDDEPSVLRAIKRTLMDAPFDVLSAFDAGEALAILKSRPIDVLVSDIDMPGMDGLRLVSLARREHPGTLRMLLTGQSTLSRALHAINEGEVARFFPKPFDPFTFRQTLEALADRIDRVRRDGEESASAIRRKELCQWVEASFPGATHVVRNGAGEVQLETDRVVRGLEAVGARELVAALRLPSRLT